MAAILVQMAIAILVGMVVLVAVWALGPARGDNTDRPSQVACQDALARRGDAQERTWHTESNSEVNLMARTELAVAERDIPAACNMHGLP